MDTAGKNTQKIAAYIRQQLEEDKMGDQFEFPHMPKTRLRVAGNRMRVADRHAPSWARLVREPFRRT